MKRLKYCALAALLLCGCQTDMVRAAAIDGLVQRVSERHDVYVKADESLDEDERKTYLRSTELLRKVLEEAQK